MTPDTQASTDALRYQLVDDVRVEDAGDRVVFTSPRDGFAVVGLSEAGRAALAGLDAARRATPDVDDAILAADGAHGLALFYAAVGRLARTASVRIQAAGDLATLVPASPSFAWTWAAVAADTPVRLSRFAYVHRDDDGRFTLESPLAHARIDLTASAAFGAVGRLGCSAASARELAAGVAGLDLAGARALVALLAGGGFAGIARGERIAEDDDPVLRQWDFHDLLFHSRSRLGRHDRTMGGTYRFAGALPPRPAVKEMHGVPYIELPRPDLRALAPYDPSLLEVMETRASVRDDTRRPITALDLATFLYRVARVKARIDAGKFGELSKRPFPNGGASYELELYLTIDRCADIRPGFYWYHPEKHRLYLVREHNADTRALLTLAHFATGQLVHPQVLITIAARFQRVAWKYAAMAYATILKNTGVLYATMYNVATAMGLAPCGVGLGDSDLFARVAGTNYYEETSVGEFILGGRA